MDDRQTPPSYHSRAEKEDPIDAAGSEEESDDVAENDASDDAVGRVVDIGVLVAHSPRGDSAALRSFAEAWSETGPTDWRQPRT